MLTVNPKRTIAELKELRALTADENGAQRIAWTDTWLKAREWFTSKLAGLPVEDHYDAAGNRWITLPGASKKALILGSHLDSVPNGGWLDGCLGVMTGLEVLRGFAQAYDARPPVTIRPMEASDLDTVDRILRTAFGTFLGAPDPAVFFGDADLARTRWRADPSAALAAELAGTVVGSNFAANWGSVGFFGPLSVRPDLWDRGIARHLVAATMDRFEVWGTGHVGLFTFPHSTKHVALYHSFGFWPRLLTVVLGSPVVAPDRPGGFVCFSELGPADRAVALAGAAALTGAVFAGLDVTREIEAVAGQQLGETVLLHDGAGVEAVAVCHLGAGTEAGGGKCYVKFAAVRPGPAAARAFDRLVDACLAVAAAGGADTLSAGVNFDRERAYTALRQRGFRPLLQGVTMHRPNEVGYDRPDVYVLDDWR